MKATANPLLRMAPQKEMFWERQIRIEIPEALKDMIDWGEEERGNASLFFPLKWTAQSYAGLCRNYCIVSNRIRSWMMCRVLEGKVNAQWVENEENKKCSYCAYRSPVKLSSALTNALKADPLTGVDHLAAQPRRNCCWYHHRSRTVVLCIGRPCEVVWWKHWKTLL